MKIQMQERLDYMRKNPDAWLKEKDTIHTKPIPECLEAYKVFCASGKYPYHAQVARWMLQYFNLGDEYEKTLHTQSYLSAQVVREEKEMAYKNQLVSEGWTLDIQEWAKTNPTAKRANVILKGTDMLGRDCEKKLTKCRVGRNEDNTIAYILPPRCTRKGYAPSSIFAIN